MKRTIFNPIVKDTIAFIQTSAETGGKFTSAEITLPPGGTPVTLHYHTTFSETFTAIEGELGVKTGRRTRVVLNPGETYTVEVNQLHYFYNPGDKVIKFRVELKPGNESFEKAIRILYGLAADGLTNKKSVPKSLKHSAIFLCMSDTRVPGFLTLIFPILKYIAKKAKASGEEQKLIDKYCN